MSTIFENREAWTQVYESDWLPHYTETGEINWKLYQRPRNKTKLSGAAVDLSQAKLLLISSAGGYLEATQEPFDAPTQLGDSSVRQIPQSTPFDAIAYAHEHYDHTAVNADPQVLVPLRHLEALVEEGVIGELAERVISYHGYQPDARRTEDETVPEIVGLAKEMQVNAALLVPS